MSYIADNYVSINDEMYMAGEKIPDGLPIDKISWFLKAGAIHEIASASASENPPDEEPDDDQDDEKPDNEPEDDQDGDQDDEPDEPAPEIDVMAGIVQEQGEPEKKPVRRTASPAKKRTTKGGKAK